MRIDFHGKELGSILLRHPNKKYPGLVSTRFLIHIEFKNIHSEERIKKVPDSPANSPDTCRRKAISRKEKVADSKISGFVWTGLYILALVFTYFIVGHSHALICIDICIFHSLFLQIGNDLREIETSFFIASFYLDQERQLRTFAPIATAHPYSARKFTCHVMH